jgi:hypothetical protein
MGQWKAVGQWRSFAEAVQEGEPEESEVDGEAG